MVPWSKVQAEVAILYSSAGQAAKSRGPRNAGIHLGSSGVGPTAINLSDQMFASAVTPTLSVLYLINNLRQ